MTKENKVVDLFEALEQIKIEKKSHTPKVLKMLNESEESDENFKKNEGVGLDHNNWLRFVATKNLHIYVEKLPNSVVVTQQIEVIKEKIKQYKSVGNIEAVSELKETVKLLQAAKNKLSKLIKPKTKADIENEEQMIKDSELLKQLKDRQHEIQSQLKLMQPGAIANRVKKLRLSTGVLDSISDFDLNNDDVIDLDEIVASDFDVKTKSQIQELVELYELIAGKLDISVEDASMIPSGSITRKLNQVMLDEEHNEIEDLKDELKMVKTKQGLERKRLKGYQDVSDVMFSIFGGYTELTDEERAEAKNMISSAQIPYIQAIAYKLCSKQNKLHYLDDVVSAGLLRMAIKLDDWIDMQQQIGAAIDITSEITADIVGDMKKHLFELSGGGAISGTNAATEDHFYNSVRKMVIAELEQSGVPYNEALIDTLVADEIYKNKSDKSKASFSIKRSFSTESDYKMMIGGDDADKVDAWGALESAHEEHDVDAFADTELAYESLISNIKDLMKCFQINDNGEKTNKKVFDSVDYNLFIMMFGLKLKEDGSMYNQTEMAQELANLGTVNSSGRAISQSAVSDRLKQLNIKLKMVVEKRPKLKKALASLYVTLQQNPNALRLLSNTREERGLVFDFEHAIKNETNQLKSSVKSNNRTKRLAEIDSIKLNMKGLNNMNLGI